MLELLQKSLLNFKKLKILFLNNNLQLLREKQEFQNSGKLYRRSKDHKSEELPNADNISQK
jgi:hypothetical protein